MPQDQMSLDELMYFEAMPSMEPVYCALKSRLIQAYPNLSVKVSKTQISFRSKYIFAMASLPYRRHKGWPKEYLLVSFGLSYQKTAPRIVQSVQAYPNRWTHHVIIERQEQIDAELLSWLDEAYRFSMEK